MPSVKKSFKLIALPVIAVAAVAIGSAASAAQSAHTPAVSSPANVQLAHPLPAPAYRLPTSTNAPAARHGGGAKPAYILPTSTNAPA